MVNQFPESEETWNILFELLPVGISFLNSDHKISRMNRRLEKIMDMTQENLLKGAYANRKYLNPDNTPMNSEQFPSSRAVIQQKIIRDAEVGVVKEDGTVIWIEVTAAPISVGDLICVIVSMDITDRKQSEDDLKK